MKYRVLKVDDEYFPQYKGWGTFGWRNFKEYWSDGGRTTLSYTTEERAVSYCKEVLNANTTKPKQVVWESHPEYSINMGPE